jgi:aldose 1-epimerase
MAEGSHVAVFMSIIQKTFGVLSTGEEVFLYTIKAGELTLSVSSLGAALTSLFVPSLSGKFDDVLLGYSTLDSWTRNTTFMGVTVGRFANRIANGQFNLNGTTYNLSRNDGKNTLHSGPRGFDKKLWKAYCYEDKADVFIRFELKSPDGEEGFPGTMKASVCYGLSESNELTIVYEAAVDAPCPLNLTNHAYFNLAGEGNGDILSHEVTLHASSYLEVDENLIPTGTIIPVTQTPFDFRVWKPIQQDIKAAGGYDHCFVVDGEPGMVRPCAEVFEHRSGRMMRVFTTQPGVQFYSGNFLNGVIGKFDSVYYKHAGLCLETQHFPDSPNRAEFPSTIYDSDRLFFEKTVFSFIIH